jgi:hypothetical protein
MRERTPSPEFFAQMKEFITNSSNPTHERGMLIGALGASSTADTANFLISLATTLPDKQMREYAASNIVTTDGPMHENLAPVLEQFWRQSTDEVIVRSMACQMAQVGAASGIELLLSAALANGGTDDVRKDAAQYALSSTKISILNPHAVPPLAVQLANLPPTSVNSIFVQKILVKMTIPEATQALVVWLRNTDATAAPLVHDYVLATQHSELWQAALNPAVPFRSEANREAIRTSLAQLKASRTFGP